VNEQMFLSIWRLVVVSVVYGYCETLLAVHCNLLVLYIRVRTHVIVKSEVL
jgi:hypothetical protein